MSTNTSDIIYRHIEKANFNLSFQIPAFIVDTSLLESQNKVSVQISINDIDNDDVAFQNDPIIDIPVRWPSGGKSIMTFPLELGDDVMLVVVDKSTSEWVASQKEEIVTPFDPRRHDLSDCFVDPIRPFRDQDAPEVNIEDLEIKHDEAVISLKKDNSIDVRNSNGSYTITKDGKHKGVCKDSWSMTNSQHELIDVLISTLELINNTTVNTSYGNSPLNDKPKIAIEIAKLKTFKE